MKLHDSTQPKDGGKRLIDIDTLIAAIRAEAGRRKRSPLDTETIANSRQRSPPPATIASLVRDPFYSVSVATHVRDFTPLHGPDFVAAVFRSLLRREPEASALAHYLKLLAQGRRSRWEIVASVFVSPEARRCKCRLGGIWLTALMAAVYRAPLVGWLVARCADVLRLPPHLRDLADRDRETFALINSLR